MNTHIKRTKEPKAVKRDEALENGKQAFTNALIQYSVMGKMDHVTNDAKSICRNIYGGEITDKTGQHTICYEGIEVAKKEYEKNQKGK